MRSRCEKTLLKSMIESFEREEEKLQDVIDSVDQQGGKLSRVIEKRRNVLIAAEQNCDEVRSLCQTFKTMQRQNYPGRSKRSPLR